MTILLIERQIVIIEVPYMAELSRKINKISTQHITFREVIDTWTLENILCLVL